MNYDFKTDVNWKETLVPIVFEIRELYIAARRSESKKEGKKVSMNKNKVEEEEEEKPYSYAENKKLIEHILFCQKKRVSMIYIIKVM